jgi:hypothetical protein
VLTYVLVAAFRNDAEVDEFRYHPPGGTLWARAKRRSPLKTEDRDICLELPQVIRSADFAMASTATGRSNRENCGARNAM